MDEFFNFLNGRYSVMDGPMDMRAGLFWEILMSFLKNIISQLWRKCSKTYDILNMKSSSEFNSP